jgi:hypothetical protein
VVRKDGEESLLDTDHITHSDVQGLGKSEYLWPLVQLIQCLASKGVAKDDMLLKQLISQIKSMSLDTNNNL